MHTIKITPNLLFEYQRTSGKFIKLPNRIESNRNFFSPNWNALNSSRGRCAQLWHYSACSFPTLCAHFRLLDPHRRHDPFTSLFHWLVISSPLLPRPLCRRVSASAFVPWCPQSTTCLAVSCAAELEQSDEYNYLCGWTHTLVDWLMTSCHPHTHRLGDGSTPFFETKPYGTTCQILQSLQVWRNFMGHQRLII